jgi:hypothetical protein
MQILGMNTSTYKLTSSTSYGFSISPAPNSGVPAAHAHATATTPSWRLLGITFDVLSIAILRKFAIVKIEIKGNPTDSKIRPSLIAEQESVIHGGKKVE